MADNPNLEDEAFKKFLGESADIIGNIGRIQDGISDINRSFGETRTRYLEFAEVVSDNVADFVRLGGQASDISTTIAGIAEGSRRNVVATGETVKEIFATATYLRTTSDKLTENFAIIGVEMSDIAETTKESIDYIQSLGLNARTVMESVLTRM
jgi:methyl-accepting chemotaxis protein